VNSEAGKQGWLELVPGHLAEWGLPGWGGVARSAGYRQPEAMRRAATPQRRAWRVEAKDGNGQKKPVYPRASDPMGADTGVNLCPRARVRVQSCAQRAKVDG
jgi:hypothetical protein